MLGLELFHLALDKPIYNSLYRIVKFRAFGELYAR